MPYALLLIPLAPFLFVGFWCLICTMIAGQAWQKLAAPFQTEQRPPGPSFWLGLSRLDGVRYKNAIRARVSPQGLWLSAVFIFRPGHPPLLIPWAALGPLRSETSFWTTFHVTTIQVPGGAPLALQFNSDSLADALRPWLPPA